MHVGNIQLHWQGEDLGVFGSHFFKPPPHEGFFENVQDWGGDLYSVCTFLVTVECAAVFADALDVW